MPTTKQRDKFFRMIVVGEDHKPLFTSSLLCMPYKAGATFTGTTVVPVDYFKQKLIFLFGE